MIVWSGSIEAVGQTNTGRRYNPDTDTWYSTSTTNAPAARNLFAAVWTGTEMIVWGGYTLSGLTNTGGKYNPSTDTWTAVSTTNAPSARAYHTAVWTGTEMIVWGNNYVADSGRSGIWIGETDGGTVQNNLVIRWNQHPEFPLFGIPPNSYDQVLADRSVPIVIRYSSNITESGNITQSSSAISAPVSFASASAQFGAGGGSGSFTVSTAVTGFGWRATASDSWITITANATASGNLTVVYSVAPNSGSAGRSGFVMVAGQKFAVNQQTGRRGGQVTSQ